MSGRPVFVRFYLTELDSATGVGWLTVTESPRRPRFVRIEHRRATSAQCVHLSVSEARAVIEALSVFVEEHG